MVWIALIAALLGLVLMFAGKAAAHVRERRRAIAARLEDPSPENIRWLVARNCGFQAIQAYHRAHGVSMEEARDAVTAICEQRP